MNLNTIESVTNDNSKVFITTLFNYSFNNLEFLTQALISNALVEEKNIENIKDSFNHLVFLGESVLNFIIGELVYFNFPNSNESLLTIVRMEIINNEALGAFVINEGLGNHIIITKGEEMYGVRQNNKRMVEVLKAVIGAIYLDCYKNMIIIKIVIRDFLEPIIKDVFLNNKDFVFYGKENKGWKYKNDNK